MGAAASARFCELPDHLDQHSAQIWAEQLGVPGDDWPEEKWLELAEGDNRISREQFVKVVEELTLQPLTKSSTKVEAHAHGDEEIFAIDGSGGVEEEIIAADGDLDHSHDDDLMKGTFNEETCGEDDEDGLRGMIVPGLELVASGRPGATNVVPGDALTEACVGDEEIFAADGEPFEESEGPGVFNEADLGVGDGTGSPVRSGGEAGAPACGEIATLAVVGSPVGGSLNSKSAEGSVVDLVVTGVGTEKA